VSTPLKMQGVCSYTVTAGPSKSKLFKFGDEDSTISMGKISVARAVHFEFVDSCMYLRTLGDPRFLHNYEMENLPGTARIMARISPGDMSRQRNIIKDLARYAKQICGFICKS
jgi:hypothetical protein